MPLPQVRQQARNLLSDTWANLDDEINKVLGMAAAEAAASIQVRGYCRLCTATGGLCSANPSPWVGFAGLLQVRDDRSTREARSRAQGCERDSRGLAAAVGHCVDRIKGGRRRGVQVS